MPENKMFEPLAAGADRSCARQRRDCDEDKVELEAQYRRIGIAAVAAAAGTRPQPRKDGGR